MTTKSYFHLWLMKMPYHQKCRRFHVHLVRVDTGQYMCCLTINRHFVFPAYSYSFENFHVAFYLSHFWSYHLFVRFLLFLQVKLLYHFSSPSQCYSKLHLNKIGLITLENGDSYMLCEL
jgi:hypothetical protein